MPVTPLEQVARLLLAAALAGLIGWERETTRRPAGLRTHVLVGVGSALVMLVSQEMFLQYFQGDQFSRADPGRIAAQVVSGIGFLGAGTILREGATVRGLTTAASLWVAAAIGLAVGAGAFLGALVTTAVTLTALVVLGRLERRSRLKERQRLLRIRLEDRPGQLAAIVTPLAQHQVNIRQVEMNPTSREDEVELELVVDLPRGLDPLHLADAVGRVPGVRALELENGD
ncbi:MAG: methyltransferase [Bacillota bacterium]|nr:MAG: methyltransferase [Bacillota bacterium]